MYLIIFQFDKIVLFIKNSLNGSRFSEFKTDLQILDHFKIIFYDLLELKSIWRGNIVSVRRPTLKIERDRWISDDTNFISAFIWNIFRDRSNLNFHFVFCLSIVGRPQVVCEAVSHDIHDRFAFKKLLCKKCVAGAFEK